MFITQIKTLVNKYGISEIEYAAICVYILSENRAFSYQSTISAGKTIKDSSIKTLSSNFFNASKVIDIIEELTREFKGEEIVPIPESKKEKNNSDNNKAIGLTSNMTQEDLINYFNQELTGITDKKVRAEFQLKMLDKLDIKTTASDVEEDTVKVYLPYRECKLCPNKPK